VLLTPELIVRESSATVLAPDGRPVPDRAPADTPRAL
jgi:hypothetical protein